MTLDEAIRHCEEVAECNEIAGLESEARRQCCNDHRQLAEWLTELKELREENKVLIRECDRLIKEKGELLKKSEQIAEYKRLLKATMGDMEILYETGKDEGCLGIEFKWRYADEALKLIGGETDEHS